VTFGATVMLVDEDRQEKVWQLVVRPRRTKAAALHHRAAGARLIGGRRASVE
jgi:hypothetical protein